MKNLLQDLDITYSKKKSITQNYNSYYYNAQVLSQEILKTYQQSNQTIYILISEMPDSWLYGRGWNGGIAYGMNNIADKRYIDFNNSKIAEVRQKIIEKTGCSNLEVPCQEIMLFQGGDGVSLDGVNNTSSNTRVVVYQIDANGNYGYVQNTWHPNAENYYGSVRFFYKATKEIQTTNNTYKNETRFDYDRYNRDIARADQDIKDCQARLNNLIYTAQMQFNAIKSEKISTENNISSLQNKLNHFNQEYNIRCTKNEDFISELQKQNTQKQNIQNEKNTLVNLQSQINNVKQEIQHDEVVLNNTKNEFSLSEEKLSESQLKLKSQIELMSSQQRSYIFAETFGMPEKDFILKAVSTAGLDAGSLGFYAIEKNNKDLLKIALQYKANFGSYHYDGKSLIQHLIKTGNHDLIDFVLSLENQDFGATLLTSIEQNDTITLKTVLSHNPYLLSALHDNGYSLLHVAVSLGKIDVITTLINFDKTLLDIKSTDLESPFTVALRSKVPEVTNLLLPHINLKHEIEILTKRNNTELLKNLNEMNVDLENREKTIIEHVLLGENISELVSNFEDIDLVGLFNNYEI